MIRTWKVKGRGKYNNETVVSSEYFISHDCVSCGWGMSEVDDRHLVEDFDTYKAKWIEQYGDVRKWGYQGVHHLFESAKKGDFLWTRLNGEYYVAQVPANPKELFNLDLSEEALIQDSSVQLTNIQWTKVGTEDAVPGSISTFTSNRNSIVRVDNGETAQKGYTITSLFSKRIIDPTVDEKVKDRGMIFRFIGPSGLEDIVALWLYENFSYVVIPSTSKKGTQTYEFVLVDGSKGDRYNSSRRIYIQVKNGENNLSLSDYKHLMNEKDEIWLVTTGGSIYDENGTLEPERILCYTKTNKHFKKRVYELRGLIDFIFDDSNDSILPKSILTWKSLFE